MNRELIDEIEKEMLALDERAYNYKLLSKCKQALELPKQEYVPMTDDELLKEFDECDYRSRLTSYPHVTLMNLKKVESAVVRRMKDQGLYD